MTRPHVMGGNRHIAREIKAIGTEIQKILSVIQIIFKFYKEEKLFTNVIIVDLYKCHHTQYM